MSRPMEASWGALAPKPGPTASADHDMRYVMALRRFTLKANPKGPRDLVESGGTASPPPARIGESCWKHHVAVTPLGHYNRLLYTF